MQFRPKCLKGWCLFLGLLGTTAFFNYSFRDQTEPSPPAAPWPYPTPPDSLTSSRAIWMD